MTGPITPGHFCPDAYFAGALAVLTIASFVLTWIASIWAADYMAGRK